MALDCQVVFLKARHLLLTAALASVLVACGGGGGEATALPTATGQTSGNVGRPSAVDATGAKSYEGGIASLPTASTTTGAIRAKAMAVQGSALAAGNAPAISTGETFSAGLKSDGTVWTWGLNGWGQLGTGSTNTSSLVPVQVSQLTGVAAVSAGDQFAVALKSDGTVWSWGLNNWGQLGNSSTSNSRIPVQVSGLASVVGVSAGLNYAVALKSDGTVWSWGINDLGQLGTNGTANSLVPVQVSGLSGVVAVSAGGGAHTLALKYDGTVWAWGINDSGQLGNGTFEDSLFPVQVSGLSAVVAISAGDFHSAAVKSDGTAWTWGRNDWGQLGNNSTSNSRFPVQVSGLTRAAAISAADEHTVALRSDGTVWAWGTNRVGNLGNNSSTASHVPVQVSALTSVVGISARAFPGHTLALKSDGTVWAWGYNVYGQLGTNSTAGSPIPVEVVGPDGLAYLNLGATAPQRQSIAARVVALNKAATVTVTNTAPVDRGPLTVETEIRQGTLVQVLRAVLDPNGDAQQVFRGLQNGMPASVSAYTLDASGNRVPAGPVFTVTPGPAPSSAATLGTTSPPVLLANGYASGSSTWDTTLAALSDASFKVSAVTLTNPVNDNPCAEALQLRDAIRSLKRQYGSKRVIVVGHSQGGLVARLYLQAGLDPATFGEYMSTRDNVGDIQMGVECGTALSAIGSLFEDGVNDVAGLVTYGTPHLGADAVVFNLGRIHPMLRPGSGFLTGLNNFAADSAYPFPTDTVVTSLIGHTSNISGDDCVVGIDSQDMAKAGYLSPTFRHRTINARKHASRGCTVSGVFRTTETDDHTSILDALGASVLRINVLSPVNVVVTSPSGQVVSEASSTIWGATYEEFLDETGDSKKIVTVPFPERGSYQIQVIPDSNAGPNATFSIVTDLNGVETTLVDHAQVADAMSSSVVVSQRVDNRLPVASAGPDQTLQCTEPTGASVLLDGSGSSDPDSDALSFAWTGLFGAASGPKPTITIPVGKQTINLTVNDGRGGAASANTRVVVQDTAPPQVTLALTPNVLWPPNHKLVTIAASLKIGDRCDPNPKVSLVSITSNQPDSGLDASDVPGDIQGASFGSDDRTFQLRAERAGILANGLADAQVKLGRVYTITYRVIDKSGNATTVSGKVTVPYSQ